MKATISDLPFIMVVLFLMGISILIGTYLKNEALADIKNMVGTKASTQITTVEYAFQSLDYIFLFVAIGLGLATTVLAYFVDVHPVMFFMSIISFILIMLVAPAFSNMFYDFANDSDFSDFADDYPLTLKVFENYPKYFMIFGFTTTVALFAKMRKGSV